MPMQLSCSISLITTVFCSLTYCSQHSRSNSEMYATQYIMSIPMVVGKYLQSYLFGSFIVDGFVYHLVENNADLQSTPPADGCP